MKLLNSVIDLLLSIAALTCALFGLAAGVPAVMLLCCATAFQGMTRSKI